MIIQIKSVFSIQAFSLVIIFWENPSYSTNQLYQITTLAMKKIQAKHNVGDLGDKM